VFKVATRSELARRMHDLIDLNAGASPTGVADVEASGLGAVPSVPRRRDAARRTWASCAADALTLFNRRRSREGTSRRARRRAAIIPRRPAQSAGMTTR
jgi:hypothetical protein